MKKICLIVLSLFTLALNADTQVNSTAENRDLSDVKPTSFIALKILKASCDMGSMNGCFKLADIYSRNMGSDENISRLFAVSKKECETGTAEECYALSLYHFNQKEFTKAKETSIKACSGSIAMGCYDLGIMYTRGDGVEKDTFKAHDYYSKSCDLGLTKGCKLAKSNIRPYITGGDKTITAEKGLGYEYRKEVEKIMELIYKKKFAEVEKILDSVIHAFEANYTKKNSIIISVKTRKEFDDYVNTNGYMNAVWLDYSYRNAYYYKAFIAIELEQYNQAIVILKELLSISPNDPQIFTELGGIYNKTGRADKGLLEYQKAYKIAKQDNHYAAVALRGMGFSYVELRDITKARESYQMSLEIEPGNEIAVNELRYIELLEKKGR